MSDDDPDSGPAVPSVGEGGGTDPMGRGDARTTPVASVSGGGSPPDARWWSRCVATVTGAVLPSRVATAHRLLATLRAEFPAAYEHHLRPFIDEQVERREWGTPDEARKKYDEDVDLYLRRTGLAHQLRRALDAMILLVEVVVPVALSWFLTRIIPTPGAVAMGVVSFLVLMGPYYTLRGAQSWADRVYWLAITIAGAATVIYALVVGAPPRPMDDGLGAGDISSVAWAVVYSAAVTLVAVVTVHLLRRQRGHVAAFFLVKVPRVELLAELVQVLRLHWMAGSAHESDVCHEVIADKLDRLRYLYSRGAEFAGLPMTRAARRQELVKERQVAAQLVQFRDELSASKPGADVTYVVDLAAQVLMRKRARKAGVVTGSRFLVRVRSALRLTAPWLAQAAVIVGILLLSNMFGLDIGPLPALVGMALLALAPGAFRILHALFPTMDSNPLTTFVDGLAARLSDRGGTSQTSSALPAPEVPPSGGGAGTPGDVVDGGPTI